MNINRKTAYLIAFISSTVILAALIVTFTIVLKNRAETDAPQNTEAPGADTLLTDYLTADVYPGSDTAEDVPDTSEKETLPENPVNFSDQFKENEDIYAWIKIENTNVNYPILQSPEDDLYYLRRGLNKEYALEGVLFTQSHNKKDFKDPVTVIYGHNMTGYGDTMFATLHNFEDPDFFEKNDKFYIFTPGHILTYEIVSAYKYDNRHIMNSFNFDDPEEVREYFDYVMNPLMIPRNVREGVELKDDDKLVVLSTCMADNNYRYLVNGVLVKDTRTK